MNSLTPDRNEPLPAKDARDSACSEVGRESGTLPQSLDGELASDLFSRELEFLTSVRAKQFTPLDVLNAIITLDKRDGSGVYREDVLDQLDGRDAAFAKAPNQDRIRVPAILRPLTEATIGVFHDLRLSRALTVAIDELEDRALIQIVRRSYHPDEGAKALCYNGMIGTVRLTAEWYAATPFGERMAKATED